MEAIELLGIIHKNVIKQKAMSPGSKMPSCFALVNSVLFFLSRSHMIDPLLATPGRVSN